MNNNGNQVWRMMPIWAKGLVVLGGAFGIYKLTKLALEKTSLNENVRDDKQEEKGWNSDYLKENRKEAATLTLAQMKQISNSLENMLDGYGSRDASIIATFKGNIKNNADFAGVNAAFGIRTIESGRGMGWLAGDERGTLTQVIQEVDNSTLTAINKDLASKGIKYTV